LVQFALGIKLRHGFGVERDDIAAMMWFRIAAQTMEPGEERAELIRNLDFTKSRLTTHQIAEAERLAQDWWDERGGMPEATVRPEDD
jgi:TPR repeat protein